MSARQVVTGILTDFGGLRRNDADHLAGMIVGALEPLGLPPEQQAPVPKTRAEQAAFATAWDAKVDASRAPSG